MSVDFASTYDLGGNVGEYDAAIEAEALAGRSYDFAGQQFSAATMKLDIARSVAADSQWGFHWAFDANGEKDILGTEICLARYRPGLQARVRQHLDGDGFVAGADFLVLTGAELAAYGYAVTREVDE